MRFLRITLALLFVLPPVMAQEKTDGPTDEKARKTYENALKSLHERKREWALDDFKKADKQDGGHCLACQKQMIKLGRELGEWKTAELGAEETVAQAQGPKDIALAHYQLAVVLLDEGMQKHKDDIFARSHEEIAKALAAFSNFPDALYIDGRALAQLKRDDEAKARFEEFAKAKPVEDPTRTASCATSAAPNWRAPEWCHLSPLLPSMDRGFPWTSCRERSFFSTFGPPGAVPAAKLSRISKRSQKSFKASLW